MNNFRYPTNTDSHQRILRRDILAVKTVTDFTSSPCYIAVVASFPHSCYVQCVSIPYHCIFTTNL
jgi:hypothetical protein